MQQREPSGRYTHLPSLQDKQCKLLTWKEGFFLDKHGGRVCAGMQGEVVW